MTPILGEELYLFMEPTSPKSWDLTRTGKYTLHSSINDKDGSNGEFRVSGYAELIQDRTERERAIQASSYAPKDRYILFKLSVLESGKTEYIDEKPVYTRWKEE